MRSSMDRIIIHNAKFIVKLGVPEEERNREQAVFATITTFTDVRRAGISDAIKDTINYADIHRQAKIAAECRKYATLEALADSIYRQLQNNLSFHSVTIQLCKPGAMAHKDVEWAGVEITRYWDEALD
jgi:FolB domain-containing protein